MTDTLASRPLQVERLAANGNGHTNGHTNGVGKARVQPNNLDAERSLLGAMLLSRDAIYTAAEICRPESFYRPAHGHIFEAIVHLTNAGEPADPVTVTAALTNAGVADSVGGLAALVAIQADTPATSNAARYARIVEDHAQLRRLIAVAGEITEIGYHPASNAGDALDFAETLIFNLTDAANTSCVAAERIGDAIAGWTELLDDRQQNGPTGTPTGIWDLDDALGGGLRPGEVCFVAARPAMGKSQIGVQVAFHVAAEVDVPSLVVSAEMPTPELLDRVVASQARVNLQRIRTGRVDDSDWAKIGGALTRISPAPMWIYAASDITLASIRAQMRRAAAQARRPLGLVVVDYLQLLHSADRVDNRQLEVDRLARGLKTMALAAGVPILALCQVNRNVESRADKRPLLSDLRESGGIEAHGDTVIALYRDEIYNPDTADRGVAELILLKQRNGPLRTVQVSYLAQFGLFANMARV